MTDYKALVSEAREYSEALDGGEHRNWINLVEHANSLADAVEALVAENKRQREGRLAERRAHVNRLAAYRADRDALRAQLDNATEEWGVGVAGSIARRLDRGDAEDARGYWPEHDYRIWRRYIGPWVEVTD